MTPPSSNLAREDLWQPASGGAALGSSSHHRDALAATAERLAARSNRREQRAAAREAQAARSRRFSELAAARASCATSSSHDDEPLPAGSASPAASPEGCTRPGIHASPEPESTPALEVLADDRHKHGSRKPSAPQQPAAPAVPHVHAKPASPVLDPSTHAIPAQNDTSQLAPDSPPKPIDSTHPVQLQLAAGHLQPPPQGALSSTTGRSKLNGQLPSASGAQAARNGHQVSPASPSGGGDPEQLAAPASAARQAEVRPLGLPGPASGGNEAGQPVHPTGTARPAGGGQSGLPAPAGGGSEVIPAACNSNGGFTAVASEVPAGAARQHRCKCKPAADGSVPRPCRFCRNVRLMTRLAHQKQLDQRSEAEQKVHTVTLLLNGLRRKHEQQLAEADEQPKLEAAPIGKAVQKLSGSARSASASEGSAQDGQSQSSVYASRGTSGTSAEALGATKQMTDSLKISVPHSQATNGSRMLAQPSSLDASNALQPSSPSSDRQAAASSASTEPPMAAQASPCSPAASTSAQNGSKPAIGAAPAAGLVAGICLTLDPGGSAAWAEARKELDAGLQASTL